MGEQVKKGHEVYKSQSTLATLGKDRHNRCKDEREVKGGWLYWKINKLTRAQFRVARGRSQWFHFNME